MNIGKTGQIILLADIGGTNARFALSRGDRIGSIDYVKVADFPTVREAISDVLTRRSGGERPKRAVLAVAGPVTNNRCVMTNSPWVIDGNELQSALGFDSVHVLNDFEVVAWSLPALQPADLIPLGPDSAQQSARNLYGEIRAAIGDVRRLVYGLRPPSLDELDNVPTPEASPATAG